MRTPAFVVLALLTLAACGSQTLSAGQVEKLERDGVNPELIYIVEIPGYTLAEQSLGGIGVEGFGASYTADGGKVAQLRIDRGSFSDADCAGGPLMDAPPDAPVTCDRDDTGWYRTAGGRHEYVIVSGDHWLRLNAPMDDPDRAALREALTGAKHQSGSDVRLDRPAPSSPVPRGDLPTAGDGAPINPTGPGG